MLDKEGIVLIDGGLMAEEKGRESRRVMRIWRNRTSIEGLVLDERTEW
jgi:hypothetical protein